LISTTYITLSDIGSGSVADTVAGRLLFLLVCSLWLDPSIESSSRSNARFIASVDK